MSDNKSNQDTLFSLRKIIGTIIALFLVSACQQNNGQQQNSETAPLKKAETVIPASDIAAEEKLTKESLPMSQEYPYKGTIQYFNLEGGFFGIVTNKGEKFLPFGLPKEYLQNGAEIEFSGSVNKDVMTIQQWGTPFKIENVKLIKPGKPVKPTGQDLM